MVRVIAGDDPGVAGVGRVEGQGLSTPVTQPPTGLLDKQGTTRDVPLVAHVRRKGPETEALGDTNELTGHPADGVQGQILVPARVAALGVLTAAHQDPSLSDRRVPYDLERLTVTEGSTAP
jgi:hypothetical protein